MKQNERLKAVKILHKLMQEKISLSYLLNDQQLTPFTKTLCFGVCRYFYCLEHMADQWVDKRPKNTELWIVLLLGLYQLHYLKTPDFAAVKETVNLAALIQCKWAKGFLNGVLRQYCRQRDSNEPFTDNNLENNHPKWLIKKLKQAWPEDWQAILTANDCHPPMTLRINQQQCTPEAYQKLLKNQQIDSTIINHTESGICLKKAMAVNELPGFNEGAISVQDAAAQFAAILLQTESGMRVLDACAAPGGKTAHILEKQPDINCLALDIDEKRLQRIQDNLKRLKLKATVRQADASQPNTWWSGQSFDRILLDAPCSAVGVIRRHPDIKLLRKPNDISQITQIQAQLLDALWPLLAANGLMVYATCSILPEENEQQIQRFLTRHTDAKCEKIDAKFGRSSVHGWQILPGNSNMDGFFYSILRKNG